jgi:hypothetical protein
VLVEPVVPLCDATPLDLPTAEVAGVEPEHPPAAIPHRSDAHATVFHESARAGTRSRSRR